MKPPGPEDPDSKQVYALALNYYLHRNAAMHAIYAADKEYSI